MAAITAASLPVVLAERFPAFEFDPGMATRDLLRHFLAYVIALEVLGRGDEIDAVFDTVEEIVATADYDVQDAMIVELVESIEDETLVARFRPVTRKWWNYHVRMRDAEHGPDIKSS